MSTTVTITGFKEFAAKAARMPDILRHEIDGEVEDAARTWASGAKKDAPVDMGFLKGQIATKKGLLPMEYEVTSGASYSAYIEWGTKSRAIVPANLSSYARQFMGKGTGDYYDFLNAILDWVKRKGLHNITNSYTGKKVAGKAAKENLLVLAEAIAFSIIRHGIKPHPYFFIQMPIVQAQLDKGVKTILNTPH